LAEVDWSVPKDNQAADGRPIVSPETLKHFSSELKARARARKAAEQRNKPRRRSSPPAPTSEAQMVFSSTLADDLATLSLSASFPALPSPEHPGVSPTRIVEQQQQVEILVPAEDVRDDAASRSFAQIISGRQQNAADEQEGKKRGKRKKIVLLSTESTRR
jgi:hypothetical protein